MKIAQKNLANKTTGYVDLHHQRAEELFYDILIVQHLCLRIY